MAATVSKQRTLRPPLPLFPWRLFLSRKLVIIEPNFHFFSRYNLQLDSNINSSSPNTQFTHRRHRTLPNYSENHSNDQLPCVNGTHSDYCLMYKKFKAQKNTHVILGAFEKLRIATVTFIMSCSSFLHSRQIMGLYLRLGQDSFLSNPFHFITQLCSHKSSQ